ncbi:hypothetical protein [Marispirochaeta sp.]|jgi:hypothetical protein|uniref:hypothetical protein n=1 Tax=Marispirochaeta sp. TaxID=2038653 RepID=UPI0029C837B8|nr:hypothetical protein [Marispirochaeta sp.]
MNLKHAIVNFLLAYIVVTVLCYGSTIIVGILLGLPFGEELGVGALEDPAFLLTVPYHIIINALTWMGFGYLYLKKTGSHETSLLGAFSIGALWLAIALVIDVFAFVLIKSPYSMTAREFYIDYQPWITLTYLTVIGGPVAAYPFSKLAAALCRRERPY